MLELLNENAGTVAVGLVVLFILAAAFMKIRRDKKKGTGCCGGCAGCPSQGLCGSDKKDTDKNK